MITKSLVWEDVEILRYRSDGGDVAFQFRGVSYDSLLSNFWGIDA